MSAAESQTDQPKMADIGLPMRPQIPTVNNTIVDLRTQPQRPQEMVEVNGEDVGANHSSDKVSLVQMWKGFFFASMSALFLSLGVIIVKYLKYIPSSQLSTARYAGMLLVSLPSATAKYKLLLGTSSSRWFMLARSLSGAVNLNLRFFAYQCMPIGEASTILFSTPMFVTLMARVFLKEACSVIHIITCILTIVGIALISKLPQLFGDSDTTELTVDENEMRLYGEIAAMSSCFVYATVLMLLCKLKETDPHVITFHFSWIALVSSAALSFSIDDQLVPPENFFDAGLVALLAVTSFFAQMMLVYSVRAEQVGPVSLISSLVNIALVFIGQVLLFEEIPNLQTTVGVIVVISCVLFTLLRKWALNLPEQSNTRRRLGWCL